MAHEMKKPEAAGTAPAFIIGSLRQIPLVTRIDPSRARAKRPARGVGYGQD
jgi:hypothetical protein